MSLRRVPWTSWEEWYEVRDGLMSAAPQSALNRVAAWRSRGHIPVSVEATASILESLPKLERDPKSEALRLACALAVVRLVNGLTESIQSGLFAESVSSAARKLELPQVLVSVRHGVTHGVMAPSTEVAAACRTALRWFAETYWERQTVAIGGLKEKVVAALESFRTAYRRHAKHAGACGGEKEGECADLSEAKSHVSEVVSFVNSVSLAAVCDVVLPVLVDCGFLVPSTDKPRAFRDIPEAMWAMWSVALGSFVKSWPHFASGLAVILARRAVAAEREYERSLLVAWYSRAVSTWSEEIGDDPSLVSLVECVMSACVKSRWIDAIADRTIDMAPPELAASLGALRGVARVSGKQIGKMVVRRDESEMLELDDAEAVIAELKRNKEREDSSADSNEALDVAPWSLAKPFTMPIGLLPDGSVPDLTLPAELDEGVHANFVDYAEEEDYTSWMPLGATREILAPGDTTEAAVAATTDEAHSPPPKKHRKKEKKQKNLAAEQQPPPEEKSPSTDERIANISLLLF